MCLDEVMNGKDRLENCSRCARSNFFFYIFEKLLSETDMSNLLVVVVWCYFCSLTAIPFAMRNSLHYVRASERARAIFYLFFCFNNSVVLYSCIFISIPI